MKGNHVAGFISAKDRILGTYNMVPGKGNILYNGARYLSWQSLVNRLHTRLQEAHARIEQLELQGSDLNVVISDLEAEREREILLQSQSVDPLVRLEARIRVVEYRTEALAVHQDRDQRELDRLTHPIHVIFHGESSTKTKLDIAPGDFWLCECKTMNTKKDNYCRDCGKIRHSNA